MRTLALLLVASLLACSSSDPIGTSEDSSALTVVPSGTTLALNAVTFGGSKVVVVGAGSTELTGTLSGSTLAFTRWGLPVAGLTMTSASYGNGAFVIGGSGSDIFHSTDGIVWASAAQITPPCCPYVEGLAFNDGLWEAAPSVVELKWADTSLSAWTGGTFSNPSWAESFRGIAPFGASGFVAVGCNGDVRVSQDGKNWPATKPLDIYQPDLYGVATQGSEIVAVGAGGAVWISGNGGGTWATTHVGSANLNAVAYGDGLFVAVGNGGVLATSPDGYAWTTRASGTAQNLRGVAVASSGTLRGTLVAVGDNGTILQGSVCSYLDLATDPNNCGKCGNVCGANAICAASQCVGPATNVSITRLSSGAMSLVYQGVTGVTYRVDASEDLTHWASIGTAVAGSDGKFTFVDTAASSYPERFYRAMPVN